MNLWLINNICNCEWTAVWKAYTDHFLLSLAALPLNTSWATKYCSFPPSSTTYRDFYGFCFSNVWGYEEYCLLYVHLRYEGAVYINLPCSCAGIIIWFNQVKYKEKKSTNTPVVLMLASIPWKSRSCHVRIIKNQAYGIKKKLILKFPLML